MTLNAMQEALCQQSRWGFSDLRAFMPRDMERSESMIESGSAERCNASATVTEEARQLTLTRLDHLLYQWWDDATGDHFVCGLRPLSHRPRSMGRS